MKDIYKQTAEELGISEYIVETVIKHKFAWLRIQLKEINNVAILDNNFGTFYVPASKIKKYLKYLHTKKCTTNEEEEKLQRDIVKYEDMLEVIQEYDNKKKIKK